MTVPSPDALRVVAEEPEAFYGLVGRRPSWEELRRWHKQMLTLADAWQADNTESHLKDERIRLYELESRTLQEAIRKLAAWVPEAARPTMYAKAFGYPIEHQDDGAEFLTEAFLYPALGKSDARTLLALWQRIVEACGV